MIVITGDHEAHARTLSLSRSSGRFPIDADEELLAALRRGEPMAAEDLVSRYGESFAWSSRRRLS